MKIICFSKRNFEKYCSEHGFSDANPPRDFAVISICCNPEVATRVLRDGDPHFFSEDHENVLNVEFDDITVDVDYFDMRDDGDHSEPVTAQGITNETAGKIVRFIESHKDMDIMVHCRAGKSRSQAVTRYVLDFYPDHNETNPDNPCVHYNVHTYFKLKKARKSLLC